MNTDFQQFVLYFLIDSIAILSGTISVSIEFGLSLLAICFLFQISIYLESKE